MVVEIAGNLVDEVIGPGVVAEAAIDADKKMQREGINSSSKRLTIVTSKTEFKGSFLTHQ